MKTIYEWLVLAPADALAALMAVADVTWKRRQLGNVSPSEEGASRKVDRRRHRLPRRTPDPEFARKQAAQGRGAVMTKITTLDWPISFGTGALEKMSA
jgi:hypothetical protein